MFAKPRGRVAPSNRRGVLVTLREVVHHPVFQCTDIGEMRGGQHLALQRGEDDLHLIQPGGIDRQPVDANREGQLQRSDPPPDLLGGMGGAVVQDQMQHLEALGPEALEQHLEKGLELHEPLARPAPHHRLAGVHEQPREEMQDPLAHIAGPIAHRRARLGGVDSACGGSGLHAGLLIGTDDALSSSSEGVGPLVEVQHHGGFLEELRIGGLLPGVALPRFNLLCPQPVPKGGGGDA